MPMIYDTSGTRDAPIITCDVCGKRITNAEEANVHWHPVGAPYGRRETPAFTHKTPCTLHIDHDYSYVIDLALFLYQLTANTCMTPAKMQTAAARQLLLESVGP